jgi:hypothetical protein
MAAPRPKGNTRTNQDQEFTAIENQGRSNEILDRNEKQAKARDAETVAPDAAGMDVVDRAQRMGKTMTTPELVAKLKAINPNFVVQVSKSDGTKCGLYLPQWQMTPTGGWKQELVHLLGFENTAHPLTGGIMPEFSIVDTMDDFEPSPHGQVKVQKFKAETRGWRTVVAMLLLKGIITRHDVEKHFGLTPSKESARWWEVACTPLEIMSLQAKGTA